MPPPCGALALTGRSRDRRRPGARRKPTCPRSGDACPRCHQARLDYNGLIQLACPRCGYVADTGGFT